MTKHVWKVGDRARINHNSWGEFIGRTGTVVEISNSFIFLDISEGGPIGIAFADIHRLSCSSHIIDYLGPSLTAENILQEYCID